MFGADIAKKIFKKKVLILQSAFACFSCQRCKQPLRRQNKGKPIQDLIRANLQQQIVRL